MTGVAPAVRSAAVCVLAAVLVAVSSAIGASTPRAPVPAAKARWVNTWTSMPQLTEPGNMPPPPFTQSGRVFEDATLRQTIRVTVGGSRLRLRFSNAFGGADLPITRAAVALPEGGRAGVGAIRPGTSRALTFHGRPSVEVPVGAQVVSDPLSLDVAAGTVLTVTTYLADGQASTDITSHPGSRTTSYMLAGDHVADTDLSGATTANHWYFVSGAETLSPPGAAAAVILGDSLTDGRGATTNMNDRWPDRLFDRLHARPATADVAILNQAAGGNRVLHDGLGPNALSRIDRDVLAQTGVRWLVVFEGVNDIGTAEATESAQKSTADRLIAAYDQIIVRAHAQGIKVYGATITPFGGNDLYDDGSGVREATRHTVNDWIRTSGGFDAVIDFDRTARDPSSPARLRPAYDVGDHLHLNPTGYRALADAVPARLLTPRGE